LTLQPWLRHSSRICGGLAGLVARAMRASPLHRKVTAMAKAVTIKVKLSSTADTGYFYVTKKNSRTMTDKLSMKKYDPIARSTSSSRKPRSSEDRPERTKKGALRRPFC
jgi:large subunit ribosomal protein L33